MIHDVVIVGSGPAGYTAAIYAARAQLNPVILAGSVTAGGALMNTTEVENYPGFVTGIMGPELMTQMQEQAERFGADIRYEDVTALELEGDVKRITTSDGVYEARTVIISTGSEYRHLGIDGEERLSGHGVSYCATCDGLFFKDQDPKISFAWNSRVVELHGEDSLTGVTLEDTVTGDRRRLEATGLFVAIGQVPRSELVTDVLELDEAGYIKVEAPSQRTRIPGVFACGDVADPTYQQAITAAGSGCRAALDAEHYLTTLQA